MSSSPSDHIRDAGYETLFLLGGFLALAAHPTPRNLDRILRWIDETQSRRTLCQRLKERGLIEPGEAKGRWVARLTELGRTTFAGGRHPDEAWGRSWDGKWRLLTFDLPRKEEKARTALRQWLRDNHFGHLQGSVWVSPDHLSDLEAVIAKHNLDPTGFMVFEGSVAGKQQPCEVSAAAWDFEAINASYRDYLQFTTRALRTISQSRPSWKRLQAVLREDRQAWWTAIRRDPLLPTTLHPRSYQGPAAWKARRQFHNKLGKFVNSAEVLK